MRLTLALLAAAFLAIPGRAADDEKYTSKDGKFAIQFPAGTKPKTETKKAGDLDLHGASVFDADKIYIVLYIDLPDAVKALPAKTVLDGVVQGAVKDGGGKLESSKDITYGKDKFPGREVVVDKDGNKVKSRFVLAGQRVYAVLVGGPKEFATGKDAAKYLDSFEITK